MTEDQRTQPSSGCCINQKPAVTVSGCSFNQPSPDNTKHDQNKPPKNYTEAVNIFMWSWGKIRYEIFLLGRYKQKYRLGT